MRSGRGDPDRIHDLSRVRREFRGTRWMAWNRVRTLLSAAALLLLVLTSTLQTRGH
jgi:uncharacterized membrane protein